MGYEELSVSASHMVGKFKYVIGENSKGEKGPCEVYLEEAQLSVTPAGGGCVHVSTKYKVMKRGRTWWEKENDIYDTKEDVYQKLEWMKKSAD